MTVQSTTVPASRRVARVLGAIAFVIASLAVAIFVLEGGTSLLLFARDYTTTGVQGAGLRPPMERDTLLGWVNRPNFSNPNEYGKGVGLTTDSVGFRASGSPAQARASVRIACSGDSFALGAGVDDAHVWCALLEREIANSRTLNLGQASYGLDQALLRYARDGASRRPNVHFFTMNDAQFEPSLTTSYLGRFKPALSLRDKRLVVEGVPVPPQTAEALSAAATRRVWEDLRFVQWLRGFDRFNLAKRGARDVQEQWALFDAIIDSLARLDRAGGTKLALVYLPTRRDLRPNELDELRRRIGESARAHSVDFIDLAPRLRAMRRDSQDLAFIGGAPAGAPVPGVGRNYSNVGNGWVARELAAHLRGLPELAPLAAAPSEQTKAKANR